MCPMLALYSCFHMQHFKLLFHVCAPDSCVSHELHVLMAMMHVKDEADASMAKAHLASFLRHACLQATTASCE